jgi:hypothetical protein
MGQVDSARLLLEQGADISARADDGKTPLGWVKSSGGVSEMTKLLKGAGGQRKTKTAGGSQ